MTGYGRSVLALGGREITVELKAVNNRYLDCSVRLPRIFSFAEDAIRQRVLPHDDAFTDAAAEKSEAPSSDATDAPSATDTAQDSESERGGDA